MLLALMQLQRIAVICFLFGLYVCNVVSAYTVSDRQYYNLFIVRNCVTIFTINKNRQSYQV